MGIVDDLVQGRQALERHDWAVAQEHLTASDPAALGPDDLHALATAAFLAGDRDTSVRAWQQAFRLHLDSGATLKAAEVACWIAFVVYAAGDESVGNGWVARAARLLEGHPEEGSEHGFVLLYAMYRHLAAGRLDDALTVAQRVSDIGLACRDPDLVANGLSSQGRLLVYTGRVHEGVALLDEAMVGVVAGEVSPIVAGSVYCSMVEGCQEIGDVARMTQWTDALSRWCEGQPGLVAFTGQCAVHRAQIMRSHGAYAEALLELDLALARYEAAGSDPAAGLALYERGEVLRICGDFDAATVAYDAAEAYGHHPQPGLALLWLARGRVPAALHGIRRLLDEHADPVRRSRLLPAAVDVFLGAGEITLAQEAATEVDQLAHAFESTELAAWSAFAQGAVALAQEQPKGALTALRTSCRVWLELGSPYEAARVRTHIGLALRALGDEESAVAEIRAAQQTFGELGAVPALREVERLSSTLGPDGLTGREVEVLRLAAEGLSNQQIAATMFLSDRTIGRHLSNIFAKIGVATRTAAAAYAYEHGLAR